MVIDKYIQYLEFARLNPKYTSELSELAYSIINGRFSKQEISESKKLLLDSSIIIEDDGLNFKSVDCLNLYYIIYIINGKRGDLSWEELINLDTKKNHLPISKYEYVVVSLLSINIVFNISLTQVITEKSNDNLKKRTFEIFPFIVDSVDNLIRIILVINFDFNNDGLNYLYENISKTAEKNKNFGISLIEKIESMDDNKDVIVPYVFRGLSKNINTDILTLGNIINRYLESNNIEKQIRGIQCLLSLDKENLMLLGISDELISKIESVEKKSPPNIDSLLIKVYSTLINIYPNSRDKLELIIGRISQKDDFFALAVELFLETEKEYDRTWYKMGLLKIASSPNQYIGTYKNIEFALNKLLEIDSDIVFEYFNNFIPKNINTNSNGVHVAKEIFINIAMDNKPLLEKWISIWLNHDESEFHVFVREICGVLYVNKISELNLSPSILNEMNIEDIKFIIYKIGGYIYLGEHLRSLCYSSLIINNQELYNLVKSLMINYIIYNYPSTLDYLKEKKDSANEQQIQLIDELTNYFDSIYSLRKSKPIELHPSLERREIFFKMKAKLFQNEDTIIEPNNNSFLNNIPVVNIKAGRANFYRNNNFGDKNRYLKKHVLGEYSASFEMPSGEIIDPVGQEYLRIIWKNFKRKRL